MSQLLKCLLMTSAFAMIAPAAISQNTPKSIPPKADILSVTDIELPKTSAAYLLRTAREQNFAQVRPNVAQVTGVKVNTTNKGVDIILQSTVKSTQLKVTPKIEGNSYIAEISNAQLQLPSGIFRQEKPVVGITEITVTNINNNSIRLTVIGEKTVPKVDVFDSNEGLVFGVISAKKIGQQNQAPIETTVTAKPENEYNPRNSNVGTRTE